MTSYYCIKCKKEAETVMVEYDEHIRCFECAEPVREIMED